MSSEPESRLSADEVRVFEWICTGGVSACYSGNRHVVRLMSLKLVEARGDYLVATPLGVALLERF